MLQSAAGQFRSIFIYFLSPKKSRMIILSLLWLLSICNVLFRHFRVDTSSRPHPRHHASWWWLSLFFSLFFLFFSVFSCIFVVQLLPFFPAAVAAVLCCFCMLLCHGSHMGRGIIGLRNQFNNLTSRDLACETGGDLTYHYLPFHQLDVENHGKPILCNTVDICRSCSEWETMVFRHVFVCLPFSWITYSS